MHCAVLFTAFILLGLSQGAPQLQSSLEAVLPFFEYCHYKNYPVEDHLIPTHDHYNLRFYRIQAKNTTITGGKRVVYLQHGLVDSSDTWITNNESLAPAFYLANKGFDVWVGNSRGNRYSNKKLSPSVIKFWDFTFHDMAMGDLPGAFSYIARVTGRKIHYIGHSQGTLSMFIALSQKVPEVLENILSFNAFGPVAYVKHQKSKVFIDLAKTKIPELLVKSGQKSMLMLPKSSRLAISHTCKEAPFTCKYLLKVIAEMNNTVNNIERLPIPLAHFPSGSSSKNFLHFAQLTRKEVFRQFDYGTKGNRKHYGQDTPPDYNLSAITLPVHLHVGKYDKLADLEDNELLFNALTNSQDKTKTIYAFGHATFIWGRTLIHVDNAIEWINQAEPL